MATFASGQPRPPVPDLAWVGAGVPEAVPGRGLLAAGHAREDRPAAAGIGQCPVEHAIWFSDHRGALPSGSRSCRPPGAKTANRGVPIRLAHRSEEAGRAGLRAEADGCLSVAWLTAAGCAGWADADRRAGGRPVAGC